MSARRKPSDYPEQVVTKRGIVELHLSPASMHEFLQRDLALSPEQILRIARDQMREHPKRETFWQLVAYNAMSEGRGEGRAVRSVPAAQDR